MTLAEFGLLVERDRARRRADDWRSGVIASILANVYRGKNSRAREPADFFASLKDGDNRGLVRGQSPEAMLEIFKVITGAQVSDELD